MGLPHPQDTIVGLSTPPGAAARALVRLSGERARSVAGAVIDGPLPDAPFHAESVRVRIAPGATVPAEIVLMRAPRSYTREDMAEIHLAGAPPLAAALVEEAVAAGARPAGPGEFTLRAFLNGRLDLVQAEAVAGVIEAQDRHEMRAARRALSGQLSTPLRAVEDRLLSLCAEVEAAIDFVDQDVQIIAPGALQDGIRGARSALADLASGVRERRPSRHRPRVVLFGPPNAGKTTLFNALCDGPGPGAIASPLPGTTRDLLHGSCRAAGTSVDLWDSPGLFESAEGIDRLATERSLEWVRTADVILLVVGLDAREAARPWMDRLPTGIPLVRVYNKLDLAGAPPYRTVERELGPGVPISALKKRGLKALETAIREALPDRGGGAGDFCVSARQMTALREAQAALMRADDMLTADCTPVLEATAADLREAAQALGALTGRNVTEDVLGRIFERFCIGK